MQKINSINVLLKTKQALIEKKKAIINQLLIKKAKEDFKSFVYLFYNEVSAGNNFESSLHTDILIKICQLKADRKLTKDVNIIIPPGHTKTTICNVLYTAFLLIKYPNLRKVYGCNSKEEGLKRNEDVINIMNTAEYKQIAGDNILRSTAKGWIKTNKGGGRRVVSTDIATRFTGGDADMLLIDDANDTTGTLNDFDKVQDWFYKKAERRLRRTKFDLGVFNIQQLTGEGCLANILMKRKNTFTLALKAYEENDVIIKIPLADGTTYDFFRPKGFLWQKKESEYLAIKEEKPFIWETQYQANVLGKRGTLFTTAIIEKANNHDLNGRFTIKEFRNMLSTIVIAVDPAVTNTENSDRTGIIVCGINALEEYFILEDMSGFYEPSEWARMVHFLYDKWQANFIVVEVNQGGSLLTSNLNAFTDGFKRKQYLNIKEVRAKYGKLIRAEPIQTLYAKNKVKHIHYFKDQQGDLLDLESEMLFFTGNGNEKSPDRLDSMVHGLTSFIQGQEVSRQDAFDNVFTENEDFDF
jgi:hypothetical protein